ncbi:hypothetical protein BGY98DRAFT_1101511 [Russula aff. rugulosa BPL654]|nr:hypothetical protein BGY98DRAFT_1101511 [Russula aff. rugulosa BPL654]
MLPPMLWHLKHKNLSHENNRRGISPTEGLQQRASDLTGQGQVDSEAVWHPFDDRDSLREKNCRQRLDQTVTVARAELFKATQKAKFQAGGAKRCLRSTSPDGTALGAALAVKFSILGGASTLVTSYMARTKARTSYELRNPARALDRFT